jgi:predicted HTH transcriptional regulator
MAELTLSSIEDIQALQESAEVECKLAGGRDGKGAVPNDMWETYSAFANTRGGVILLGIKEKRGQFSLEGITTPAPLIKNIVDTVNNPNKISCNLLSERDVRVETIEGKSFIRIDVPRAQRKERPIYINGNPLTGSFIRRYEADQRCSIDSVKQMMAEQENERDQRMLEHFTIDDIEPDSLRVYRQMFKDAKPQHPFLELSDQEFLRSIRAWRRERASGLEGLTLAGLIMFGRWDALQDAFPAYSLDYQEKDDSTHRWVDRIYTDGSWSGNAFDFYRKVYRKLTADLKVSFQLNDDQRVDTSPAHEAIREALVNTLAHADFDSDDNILIEKHPDFIGFRNPGLMRIPVQEAIAGGNSQCRNPAIHQMFLNIGLSEKAGSGIPKIYSNCRQQNWQPPHLYEKYELGQTLLELRMVNILSPELHQQLVELFGEDYKQLSELKRTILVTAVTESWFNHERICSLSSEHTREVTLALSQLVSAGYLQSAGKHKGKIYHLKGIEVPTPDNDAGKSISFVTSPSAAQLSLFEPEVLTSAPDLNQDAPDLVPDLVPELHKNVPESANRLTEEDQQLWIELKRIATPVTEKQGRKHKSEVKNIILKLCSHAEPNCLRLSDLAELLNMNSDTLRRHYLSPMTKEQQLYLAFPTVPNHPEQGYTTQNNTNHN